MKKILILSALVLSVMLVLIAGSGMADSTYQVTQTLSDGNVRGVNSLAFNSDGTLLVSGNENGTVSVWDVKTGKVINILKGHGISFSPESGKMFGSVNSVAFTPDGKVLASAGSDSVIILWNAATWEKLRSIGSSSGPLRSVAFSPDGKMIAGGGGVVSVWNAGTGEKLKTFDGHSASVNSMVYCNDGKLLASGSTDRTIIL